MRTLIDLETWPRREHFAYYRDVAPCTYAMTVHIDVTEAVRVLRLRGRKSYVVQIWALASVVNRHDEFRMTLTESGEPARWDVLDPMFTVFNPRRETFAAVSSPFDTDFAAFHEKAAGLLEDHRGADTMFPQGDPPPNVFDISSLPWTHFSGFDLHIRGGFEHLLPIFTLGRYLEQAGRTLLPLAVQVHHAAADGFHTARLVNELQELFADPHWIR